MYSRSNSRPTTKAHISHSGFVGIVVAVLLLGACAHPITINPTSTPLRSEDQLYSKKVVGYVMTDADREKQVTTEGGGGDKVSYFPYRDIEKDIRDALKSIYSDVVLVRSPTDVEAIQREQIFFVFALEIYTNSNSDSIFTWPPTKFSIDLLSTVTDATGNILARVRVIGQGAASFSEFSVLSFSEFSGDYGLAGRRAARDALEKFTAEIRANQRLR